MWRKAWRGLVIAVLGAATLGFGLCSLSVFPESLWGVLRHGFGNYRDISLVVSSVGLIVALLCGLALRWFLRRKPAEVQPPSTHDS